MKTALPAAAAIVAIVSCSIIQGLRSERWGSNYSAELESYRQHMVLLEDKLLDVGTWKGEVIEADEEQQQQLEVARVAHSISRSYRNTKTGDKVSIFLVCGDSMHTSIHTPEQCYVAAGFNMREDPHPYEIHQGSRTYQFKTAAFKKEEAIPMQRLQIFWGWRTIDKPWYAPPYDRFALAGIPALYKMYVIHERSEGDDRPLEDTPSIAFIRDVLPAIDEILEAELEPHAPAETEGPEAGGP